MSESPMAPPAVVAALLDMSPSAAVAHRVMPNFADLGLLNFLAETGHTEEARDRLRVFADSVARGTYLRAEHWDWLGQALRRIADGEDANKAFGLHTRGRPVRPERLAKLKEAAEAISHRPETSALHDSGSRDGAFKIVAKELGISVSEVRRGYELFGPSLRRFMAGGLWQEELPDVALVRRKLRARK